MSCLSWVFFLMRQCTILQGAATHGSISCARRACANSSPARGQKRRVSQTSARHAVYADGRAAGFGRRGGQRWAAVRMRVSTYPIIFRAMCSGPLPSFRP